jgi:hypothetical protein
MYEPSAPAAASSLDPVPWSEDLRQVKKALATQYAKLDWVVFEHAVDLNGLPDKGRAAIELASNDADARMALDMLARELGDGHLFLISRSRFRRQLLKLLTISMTQCAIQRVWREVGNTAGADEAAMSFTGQCGMMLYPTFRTPKKYIDPRRLADGSNQLE